MKTSLTSPDMGSLDATDLLERVRRVADSGNIPTATRHALLREFNLETPAEAQRRAEREREQGLIARATGEVTVSAETLRHLIDIAEEFDWRLEHLGVMRDTALDKARFALIMRGSEKP